MHACPSRAQLEAMLTGQLDEAGSVALETHVQTCALCQETLEEITSGHGKTEAGSEIRPAVAAAGTPHQTGDAEDLVVGELKRMRIPLRRQRDSGTMPNFGKSAGPVERPSLAGYEILSELGRGGMGIVFKARHLQLKRLVALKIVSLWAQTRPELLARFRREAEAVARLQHPNIVQIHEVGEQNGQAFLSLEYVEGGTLEQRLAGAPQPPGAAAQLVETLARAMHFAHERGVIHRDLKPANVLLGVEGGGWRVERNTTLHPKITDFGLAKQRDQDPGQTDASAIVGTPSYMAPEQAVGNSRAIGPAADIYALGAILYEMLTGRPPFRGETALDTVQLLKTEEPVPPRRLEPKVPRDLETICLKCLQKEPRKRYPSALALAEDLARFGAGQPIEARPVHAVERLWRLLRRNPLPASLAGLIFLLLLTIAIGATVSAWMLREERNLARQNEQTAQRARQEATDRLWDSYLAQARAGRYSGRMGRSFDGLEALTRAAAIQPSLDLRNEAIACMTLPDLRFVKQWEASPADLNTIHFDTRLEHYAISDAQGNIAIRRVTDNEEIMRLPGPGDPAWVVQFSRDGKFLAARHHPVHKDSLDIYLWNLTNAETIRKGPIRLPGRTWDFSPDRDRLLIAAGQDDESIILFEAGSGTIVKRFPPRGAFYRLAFGPGGKLAIAFEKAPAKEKGADAAIVQVRDVATDAVLLTLPHPKQVLGMAWRNDGRFLATACADQRLYVWNAKTGQQQAVLKGHQAPVTAVTFSHGGDLLASTAWDDTLRLWDPLTGEQQVSGPCPGQSLPQFSDDDRLLGCLLSKSRIGIAEVGSGAACRTLEANQPDKACWGIDFSPDGKLLASASSDGVRFWDTAAAKEIAAAPVGYTVSVLFHPKEESLFTSGSAGVRRWEMQRDPVGGKIRLRVGPREDLGPANGAIGRMSLGLHGQVWAVTFPDAKEQYAIVRRPGRSADLRLPHPRISYCHLSPDGKWAVTGTWGGTTTKVWDAETGQPVEGDWPREDASATFSPDGEWLVTSTAAEYRFWKVKTWEPGLRIPRDNPSGVGPLAFAADGKLLAIAHSARVVHLVDSATGKEIATLAAPNPQPIGCLRFSPDGTQLAVACMNQTIHLWDLRLIRQGLAQRHLDWDMPPLPPATARTAVGLHVDLISR
jgi:eukaryotic-like serine/threonine-protein kinase